MKTCYLKRILLFVSLLYINLKEAGAQEALDSTVEVTSNGRLKFGLGASIISDGEERPGFYTFLAPTFYFSYSLINTAKFKLGPECFLSFRSKNDEEIRAKRTGFAITLPLTLELRLSRFGFYAGAGPSYVNQSLNYESYFTKDERIREYYTDFTSGIGIGFKRNPNVFMNIRFHYLKDHSSNREDGGMLSLYFSLVD